MCGPNNHTSSFAGYVLTDTCSWTHSSPSLLQGHTADSCSALHQPNRFFPADLHPRYWSCSWYCCLGLLQPRCRALHFSLLGIMRLHDLQIFQFVNVSLYGGSSFWSFQFFSRFGIYLPSHGTEVKPRHQFNVPNMVEIWKSKEKKNAHNKWFAIRKIWAKRINNYAVNLKKEHGSIWRLFESSRKNFRPMQCILLCKK